MLAEYLWIFELATALLLLIVFDFFLKKFLLRSKEKTRLKEGDWRLEIDNAIIAPARALLVVLLFSFLVELLAKQLHFEKASVYVVPLRNAGIVFCLAWCLLRWKRVFRNAIIAKQIKGKPYIDAASLGVIEKLYTVIVVFLALLIMMQIFGLSIAPLVTFGGIGAAALGISSRDLVANFFGGLMLSLTRSFAIADTIELLDKKILGEVEEIGWSFVSIRDLQKRPLYIPNALFSTAVVINWSRITHRKIDEAISIRYTDAAKVLPIIAAIRALLEHHSAIDQAQSIYVFFKNFGSYTLNIEVQAYTRTTRYDEFMGAKQRILLDIENLIRKEGAEIPLPTQAVHLTNS